MKKSFIHLILVQLMNKSHDNKVVRAITKMVEDWVKLKVGLHYYPLSVYFLYCSYLSVYFLSFIYMYIYIYVYTH